MNIDQANKLSIAGFLMSKGVNPIRLSGNYFIFDSPLHDQNDSKLKVHRFRNEYLDITTGTGGRLLDLICNMYGTDIVGALIVLSGLQKS